MIHGLRLSYRLLVFMKNGIGPKTEPWGTPFETFNKEEVEAATWKYCVLSGGYSVL